MTTFFLNKEVLGTNLDANRFGRVDNGLLPVRRDEPTLEPSLNGGRVFASEQPRCRSNPTELFDDIPGDRRGGVFIHDEHFVCFKRATVNVENVGGFRDAVEMNKKHVTDALKDLRQRSGYSMSEMAKLLGYSGASSYQRYEDPALTKDGALPVKLITKLLPVLKGKGVPPIQESEILALMGTLPGAESRKNGDTSTTLPVIGRVAAGMWQEDDIADQRTTVEHIPVARDPRYPGLNQYARAVVGDSMNLKFPNGCYVVVVEYHSAPRDGDIVVAASRRGDLVERTLKRVRFSAGKIELHPESTDPRFEKIVLEPRDDQNIEIEGYAIGIYTPI